MPPVESKPKISIFYRNSTMKLLKLKTGTTLIAKLKFTLKNKIFQHSTEIKQHGEKLKIQNFSILKYSISISSKQQFQNYMSHQKSTESVK